MGLGTTNVYKSNNFNISLKNGNWGIRKEEDNKSTKVYYYSVTSPSNKFSELIQFLQEHEFISKIKYYNRNKKLFRIEFMSYEYIIFIHFLTSFENNLERSMTLQHLLIQTLKKKIS